MKEIRFYFVAKLPLITEHFHIIGNYRQLQRTYGGIKLMEELSKIVAGTLGIAAVAVFDPSGADEETAHLLIVASAGEVPN